MDFAEAIKRQGLEYIGQGESVKQSTGFLKDVFDVKLVSRTSKYGTKLKEKTLYPVSRLLYPSEWSEFLEEGPGLSFFPPNMRDKTKFGRYLDAIKRTRINQKPDSELYLDKKGDLYEWSGGEDINKILYDKEDFGFLEGPDQPLNVQRVQELKLESAVPKAQRLKRALTRDIERRYEGKREGADDDFGEFIDKVESDEKFKREVMNKKLFESMQSATDYDNWKNNLGSKAFTQYDIEDLENEIKLIESLSYKEIRKVCSKTLEKFLAGKEVTYDDIYNDLIGLMGKGPLPKNVLPEEPKFRTVAEQFQRRVDLLPGVAPTMATLAVERATNLAETAALAKFTEYVPEIGQSFSTGIGWLGGAAGAAGIGIGAIGGMVGSLALGAVAMITKTIIKKIINSKVEKLTSKNIADEANAVKQQCIEDLKDQKAEVVKEQKEKLNEAKQIRIAANKGEITSAERDELLKPIVKEALVKEKESVILDAFTGALEEDQKEKNPMRYEFIDSDTRIKIHYTRNGKATQAIVSRYVNRDEIEDWKVGNEKNLMWLVKQANVIDKLNRKKGYKKAGPNPAKIAYFELKYGVKLPTIDSPKTENFIIQTDDIDQILEKNNQTRQELQEINNIQPFDFGLTNPLAPLEEPVFAETEEAVPFQASQLKRKQVSLGKSDIPRLVKRERDYSELEIPEGFFSNAIPLAEAKIEEETLPFQLKRKQASLGKSDITHLIERPRDYSELEVPEGFFSKTIPLAEAKIEEELPFQLKRKQASLGKSDMPRLVKAPDSEKMPKRKRIEEEILPTKHSERKRKLKHKRARNTEPAGMPVRNEDIIMEEPRIAPPDPEVSAFAADQGLFIIIIFR